MVKDKILGSILGAALGDAMGAITETRSAERIKEDFGGYIEKLITPPDDCFAHGYDLGAITDDFSLAYFTAIELVKAKGKVTDEVAKQAVLTWSEYPEFFHFAGPTTEAAVRKMKGLDAEEKANNGKIDRSYVAADNGKATNGSAMKIFSAGLINPGNLDKACLLYTSIHVSCDKPLTTTLEEARELEALAREKGLLFMVTYGYSGHVACKHIRQMIDRGDIGEIRMIAGEYIQGWLAGDDITGNKQGEWRTDPKRSGKSNCLGDIGTHIENTVARMTGLKIKKVLANMEIKVPTRVLDDNDMVMVQYDNRASGMYWSSQIAIGCDNGLRVRICGSKGSIFWFQEEPEKIKIANVNGTVTEIHRGHDCIYEEAARYARLPSGHPEGWFEAMGNLYRSFTQCILAKEENRFTEDMIDYPTVADGVEGLAFVEACLASSDAGNVWTEMEA